MPPRPDGLGAGVSGHVDGGLGNAPLGVLLEELDRSGVRLSVEEGRLRCVAPEGGLTPDLRAALRVRSDELLGHLHARQGSRGTARADRLSGPQHRLWIHQQLEPTSSAYHLPLVVSLSGPLHVAALRQSLAEVVRRHEALRTTFPTRHDGPVQLVSAYQPPPLPIVDVGGLPDRLRRATMEDLAARHAQRPFDLASGVAHRATLVRSAPGSTGYCSPDTTSPATGGRSAS